MCAALYDVVDRPGHHVAIIRSVFEMNNLRVWSLGQSVAHLNTVGAECLS